MLLDDAFHTLLGTIILLLPGALYVWAYERRAGQWRINSPDRIINFFGVSVALHALAAPLTFWVWKHYIHSGDWEKHHHLPWPLYGLLLGYLLVPALLGSLVGAGARRRYWLLRSIHERTPPRAWDALFDEPLNGWVRVRTKSGSWIGGPLDSDAWVSTYPSDGDLLFTVADVDPDTGVFTTDEAGKVRIRAGSRVLVSGNEIEYLQVDEG